MTTRDPRDGRFTLNFGSVPEMLKGAPSERNSGILHKMPDTLLRILWVYAYAMILLAFRLMQKIESPNARQRRV